jgi:hypothetical protein
MCLRSPHMHILLYVVVHGIEFLVNFLPALRLDLWQFCSRLIIQLLSQSNT